MRISCDNKSIGCVVPDILLIKNSDSFLGSVLLYLISPTFHFYFVMSPSREKSAYFKTGNNVIELKVHNVQSRVKNM
jgi:hypothetical protein